jgi:hypothetical protein
MHVGGRGFQGEERGIQVRERLIESCRRDAHLTNLGTGIGVGPGREGRFCYRTFGVGLGTGQMPGNRAHRDPGLEDQGRLDSEGGLVVE